MINETRRVRHKKTREKNGIKYDHKNNKVTKEIIEILKYEKMVRKFLRLNEVEFKMIFSCKVKKSLLKSLKTYEIPVNRGGSNIR